MPVLVLWSSVDVGEYRTARWTRLVERAQELGCSAEQAEALVEEVLAGERRRIARAEDPDPLVHEALARRLAPAPPARRPWSPAVRRWAVASVVALVLAAVVAALVVRLRPEPPPPPATVRVPSLFGLDADGAQQVLERAGLRVEVVPTPACEPEDLVVRADPLAGRTVEVGSTVRVSAALTLETTSCAARLRLRREAWRFVAFARGAAPPTFARTVLVVVDGAPGATLSGQAAGDRERWSGLLDLVVAAGSAEQPALAVSEGPATPRTCGVARPLGTERRPALRLRVGRAACPLTLDLYRSSGGIDAVVAYTGR